MLKQTSLRKECMAKDDDVAGPTFSASYCDDNDDDDNNNDNDNNDK